MNIATHKLFNQGKIKVYFVEIDDDNRERVISAIVGSAGFKLNTEQTVVHADEQMIVGSWDVVTGMDIDLRIIPDENGNLFVHEVWEDEEEE